MKLSSVIAAVLLLSGCALKQYSASPPVRAVERTQLSCEGVEKAIASQQQVQEKINHIGEFDSLTV